MINELQLKGICLTFPKKIFKCRHTGNILPMSSTGGTQYICDIIEEVYIFPKHPYNYSTIRNCLRAGMVKRDIGFYHDPFKAFDPQLSLWGSRGMAWVTRSFSCSSNALFQPHWLFCPECAPFHLPSPLLESFSVFSLLRQQLTVASSKQAFSHDLM